MQFELTYTLDALGMEVEREAMFDSELRFSFHEAATQKVEVRTVHLGQERLCRVSSSGHTMSLVERDHVTILVPRRGRVVVETKCGSLSARPNDLVVCAPNMRTTHVIPDRHGQFECDCALIRAPCSDAAKAGNPRLQPCDRVYIKALLNAEAQGLQRYIDYLSKMAESPARSLSGQRALEAAGVLLEECARPLIEGDMLSSRAGPLPGARDRRIVNIAEEIMRENYADALSTRHIAMKLGVSTRRLQTAFESVHGVPPLAVLKAIRLEEVRLKLQKPPQGGTVSSIALDCGFAHLGRFSASYSAAFGETPAETLRRSKA